MTIQFVRLHYYNGMTWLIALSLNVIKEAKKSVMRGQLV